MILLHLWACAGAGCLFFAVLVVPRKEEEMPQLLEAEDVDIQPGG